MKWSVVLLLLLPMAQGLVLEDAPGDVDIQVMGQQTTPVPQGLRDGVDIVSLDVLEDAAELRIVLGVASIQDAMSEYLEDKEILVHFSHGSRDYEIRHSALLPGDDDAWLNAKKSTETFYSRVREVPIEIDLTENTFTYILDRYDVPDQRGAPPTRGAVLDTIQVRASAPVTVALLSTGLYGALVAYLVYGEPYIWILRDYAGHDVPGMYDVSVGPEQTGTGRLRGEEPYRVSNGEAGTFVFWITAEHDAPGQGTYTLEVQDVPAGWAVQVPPGNIDISGGAPLRLPIIVQTAFAHAHGSTEEFLVLLKDEEGGSGKMQVGIRYPEVPQPAGHHDLLHLWSRPGTDILETSFEAPHEAAFGNTGAEVAYMNAATEHLGDTNSAVDFGACGGNVLGVKYCLEADLEPGLAMGLDFRMGERGKLVVPLDMSAGSITGTLDGFIEYYTMEEYKICDTCSTNYREVPSVLASVAPSEPIELTESATEVELAVTPTRLADYVPYDPTAGMRLVLNFTSDDQPNAVLVNQLAPDIEPRLRPGGTLQLPLNEYKDSVAGLPSLGQDLRWVVDDVERLANPGDIIVFQARLLNEGAKDELALRVIGHNHEWAELVGSDSVRLGSNESVDIEVVVRVPEGTSLDATAELVLEAASHNDVARRSLVQMRTALTEEEVEDDSELLGLLDSDDKKSPGLPLVFLVAGLAIALRRLK